MIFCLLRHFAAKTSHFQLKVLWGLGTQTLVPKNIFQVLLLRTNTGQGQRVHVLSIWRNKFWNFSHLAKTWWHLPEFKVCTSLPKKVCIYIYVTVHMCLHFNLKKYNYCKFLMTIMKTELTFLFLCFKIKMTKWQNENAILLCFF